MRFFNRTYLKLKYRNAPLKWKILVGAGVFALLLFGLLAIAAELGETQTYIKQQESDTYTKYFFTRHECRYIFPAGSCVVDDKYCDLNSYDYQVISLEPYEKYCHKGTIVYNVKANNTAPKIEKPKEGECDFVVDEGDVVRLVPEGYDPDTPVGPAGKLIWTFYEPFDENGVWQTKKGDAGTKWSMVKLSDGELYDEREFCVEVIKTNSAPVLSGLQDISAKEGDKLTLKPVCTDPDGDEVTITISGFMTSEEKTLTYDDAGEHEVTVTCTDPEGEKDTKKITIVVANVNRPPTLDVPESVTVDEGKTARIIAKASDPDGDEVSIVYDDPFAADGTWKTKRGDAGGYDINVTATDGDKSTTKTVGVIVNKVNSAPAIAAMSDLTVYEGDTITLKPKITDIDGDETTVAYSGWMDSATKETGYDDAGEYDVRITATDPSGAVATEDVHITVLNRNRPPVITKLK
jgi:hypothetical protein